jgi:mRNA-degrading endonuclease toxin of MazEF toxin-antitoxin module
VKLDRGTIVLLDLDPTVGHEPHLRSVDKRRVRRAFAPLPRPEMDAVDEGLALFLGLAERFGPPPTAVP